MTREEVKQLDRVFEKYDHPENKMNIFHNKETGEVITIIYNPNVVGISNLKDLLTLKADSIRNLILYYRTRNLDQLMKVMRGFRSYVHGDTIELTKENNV